MAKLIEKGSKYQTLIKRIKFSFSGTLVHNVITRTYAMHPFFLIEEIPHLATSKEYWLGCYLPT
jgi:hypothetical protein